MDLGPKLDKVLDVRYVPEVDETARRNLKRREKFKVQVQSAVRKMQVEFFKEISRNLLNVLTGEAHPQVHTWKTL